MQPGRRGVRVVVVGEPPQDGLRELYEGSYRRLVVQVAALTRSVPEAEDMVQEAFARAYVRWRRIERYDDPEAWVRKVAMNLARSRWRRARRGAELTHVLGAGLDHAPPPSEDRVAVVGALRRLPGPQREALVLFHIGDHSVEEIARQQGVPTGTVKARLSRGRTALAALLGDVEPQEVAT